MKKPLILALTLISTSLQAQTYTQIQWGMNKGINPYAFGANINGTWRDMGTVTSGGVWSLDTQFSLNSLKYISLNTDKVLNVKNYGAVCDGTTDDAAAIQTTADTAAALPGGATVFIPGRCRFATGSLHIKASSVVISGVSQQESNIYFDNGADDGIVYDSTTSSRYYGESIEHILLDFATSKTGGRAVYAPYVGTSSMEDVFINNAYDGLDLYVTNNWDMRNVWLQAIRGGSGKACLYWHAPATGVAEESQLLKLTQFGCNATKTGADGLVIDGFSQSLIGGHIEVAEGRYNVWVKNSANSTTYYPSFLNFGSLYATIALAQSVRIDAGRWMEFPSFHIENNTGYPGQGGADTYGLYIGPDTAKSVTQNISFGIGTIGHSRLSAAFVNAKDISFTGTKFAASSNTTANQDAVTLDTSAANVIFSGTQVGVTINDSTPTTWRYGLYSGTSNPVYPGNGDWVTGASPGGVFGAYFVPLQTSTTGFSAQLDFNRGGTHTYVGPSAAGTMDIYSNENIPIKFGVNNIPVLTLSSACNGYLKGAGATAATCSNTAIDLGTAASAAGTLSLANAGVGGDVITIQNPGATTGNYNFNLPATAGTAGDVLLSGGGSTNPMTWVTGLSIVKKVRDSGGAADCTLTFTNGVLTASTCTTGP